MCGIIRLIHACTCRSLDHCAKWWTCHLGIDPQVVLGKQVFVIIERLDVSPFQRLLLWWTCSVVYSVLAVATAWWCACSSLVTAPAPTTVSTLACMCWPAPCRLAHMLVVPCCSRGGTGFWECPLSCCTRALVDMRQLLEDWLNKSTFAIATWRGDAQRYWLDQ